VSFEDFLRQLRGREGKINVKLMGTNIGVIRTISGWMGSKGRKTTYTAVQGITP